MPKPRKRKQQLTIILVAVMAVVAAGIGVVAVGVLNEPPTNPGQTADAVNISNSSSSGSSPPSTGIGDQSARSADPAQLGPPLVEDNGRTLWVSPTSGSPVPLDFLPPDCQFFLRLRLAEISRDPQASRTLRALGPAGEQLLQNAEALIGRPLAELTTLTIGVRPGPNETLETTFVAEASRGVRFQPRGRTAEHAGASYHIDGNWCRHTPPTDEGRRLVIAPRSAMQELLDTGGEPPPLRREMEQLIEASDRDRHASLILAPSFLFTGGKSLFSGSTSALRDPVFAETPDDLRAMILSVHWSDERFYWEIKGAPTSDTTATQLASALDTRVARWPQEVQLALLDANPARHGRQVVAQLPLMLGVAADLARSGAEQRHAIVNGYLPASAGHNLLLAAELLLAQQSAGVTGPRSSGLAAVQPAAKTVAEKLKAPATVTFARDTLEMAVQFLSDEINVPIVIVGSDLQLEGITKNQSFGLDAQDRPAEQVLLEILTLANPEKTATGPTDPKQKLVYVTRKEADGEKIYITTRSSAEKRGEKLPALFTP